MAENAHTGLNDGYVTVAILRTSCPVQYYANMNDGWLYTGEWRYCTDGIISEFILIGTSFADFFFFCVILVEIPAVHARVDISRFRLFSLH